MAPAVGHKRDREPVEPPEGSTDATEGLEAPESFNNIDRDGEGTENFAAALSEATQQFGQTSRKDAYFLAVEGSVFNNSFRKGQTIALAQRVLAAPPDQRAAIAGQHLYAVSRNGTGKPEPVPLHPPFGGSPELPLQSASCKGNQKRGAIVPIPAFERKGGGRQRALPSKAPRIYKHLAHTNGVTGQAKVVGLQSNQQFLKLHPNQVRAPVPQ